MLSRDGSKLTICQSQHNYCGINLYHYSISVGWCEWVTVDNQRLMSIMQIKNEKTFIKCRDDLIKASLFDYRKGKKGSPNQYRINTVNFTVNNTVYSTVKSTVNNTANVTDINRLDKEKDIYLYFINKYKEQNLKKFNEKMKFLREIKDDDKYKELSEDEEIDLINYIFSDVERKES